MNDNACPLRDYINTRSEQSFRQLVEREFDLVFSVAVRVVGGDAHLAQDVAQSVFTDLARRAPALPPNVVLSGWLYRHTFYTATKFVRTERRRQARERQAAEMNALNDNTDAAWRQLAPVLDEALNALGAQDRDAIVLRFFERQPLRAVGEALGASEDGARKRVDRALEKLRAFLVRRGVVISATVLTSTLSSQAVALAPTGLAATVATTSFAGAGSTSLLHLTLIQLLTMTKAKVAAITAVLALGIATTVVVKRHQADPARQQTQMAIAKMNYAQNWAIALLSFADKNQGQFPATFAEAAPFFPKNAQVEQGLAPDQYEVLYQGKLAAIKDPPPADAIVVREKRAWQTQQGGWARAYGFADGHAEIHVENTADFEFWEEEHLPRN